MAMREILLRKATFLRAKDEGYAIAARSLSAHQRRQFGQREFLFGSSGCPGSADGVEDRYDLK